MMPLNMSMLPTEDLALHKITGNPNWNRVHHLTASLEMKVTDCFCRRGYFFSRSESHFLAFEQWHAPRSF